MSASGVLLAGGASRRFPPNKLLIDYAGEPLFWRPLRALALVCDVVVVVARADGPAPDLPPLPRPVFLVRDAVEDQGPLVALRLGLDVATGDWALVAGGDMPDLLTDLLRALVERGEEATADAITLTDGARSWPMPALFRVVPARVAAARLVDAGEKRLRAMLETLDVESLDQTWWSRYDARGTWRRDIDRPTDLR